MQTACRIRLAAAGRIAIASIALLACPAPEATVEARVGSFLAEMEQAAEAREIRPLKSAVAADYRDPDGNDRDAVVGILTYHFLRQREIHLLTRIGSVAVDEDGEVAVVAQVAMAGRPIRDAGALASLQADLYRFELALRDDGAGSFQLTRAVWRPARSEDFF